MKTISMLLALYFSAVAAAFTPQAGLWQFDDEANGQPGRGFQIDVQDSTIIVTLYGYTPAGAATFYLLVGSLANNATSGQLTTFSGGRTLGGAAVSARSTGSAGIASFSFSSDVKGTIQLPGEPTKSISRLVFGVPAAPEGLVSQFTLVFKIGATSTTTFADQFTLTRNIGPTSTGNGVVVDAAGRFGCELKTSGASRGKVFCVALANTTISEAWIFDLNVNQGHGTYFIQTASNPSGSVYETVQVWRSVGKAGIGTYSKSKNDTSDNQKMKLVDSSIVASPDIAEEVWQMRSHINTRLN